MNFFFPKSFLEFGKSLKTPDPCLQLRKTVFYYLIISIHKNLFLFPNIQWSCMDVKVGLWRRLSAKELMLLNCGVGEDSWESLGLQGDPTSPFEGDQPCVLFGRTDAKAETPVLWPPRAKSWLTRKDSDAGRDWGQENGTTEDEMAGWHHWLNGRESEWTPGVGDGQGGPACCDSWGHEESDTTEWLNWTELNILGISLICCLIAH